MEFREIYCNNCKKTLGRYNIKFYSADKIGDLIKLRHGSHIRKGHEIKVRKVEKS